MENFRNENCHGKYCFLEEILTPEVLNGLDVSKISESEHSVGQGTLEDVTDGCEYSCGFKQIASKLYSRRKLEQLRCVADYKWMLSEAEDREIGMDEAMMRWVKNGFAEKFDEVYRRKKENGEIIRHWDLYVDTEMAIR